MATYYIDYNAADDSANGTTKLTPWKRCPGMNGYTRPSYTHAAGDIFIFKGGVTWPHAAMPLSIGYSGSSGNVDTYTVDVTWFNGGAYSKPILDDGGNATSGGMIQAYSQHFWKIDGLQIDNYGLTGSSVGDKAIVLNGCHDVTITNCRSSAYCKIWAYSYQDGPAWTTYPNLLFTFNDISNVTSLLWLTVAGSGVIYDNVQIVGNQLHDGASQMVNDVHADMLIHSFPRISGAYVDNLIISRNRVYGDWQKQDASNAGLSGYIFQECYVKNQVIANNVLTIYPLATATEIQDSILVGSDQAGGTTYIVGNSVDNSGATNGRILGTGSSTGESLVVKNNIFYGCLYVELIDNTGTLDWDYNLWTTQSGSGTYVGANKTYSQWRGAGVLLDTHPASQILGLDPLFVTAHQNLQLQSSSPARGVGANLTSLAIAEILLDYTGATRPAGGAWTIGAYEYSGGGGGSTTGIKRVARYLRLRGPAN